MTTDNQNPNPSEQQERQKNFVEQIVEADLAANTHEGRVHTRFPPDPNG